jgi:hypothetical protein
MYHHIMSQLTEIVGSKAPYLFAAGSVFLVLALVLMLLAPWRKAVRAAMERGGWRAILMGTVSVLLTMAVGGTVIEVLRGSLLLQSSEFDRSHGRISQTNYDAIKTNWGPPHAQRELGVTHYVTEEKTVYQYKDGHQIPVEEVQTIEETDADESGESPLASPSAPPSSGGDKAVEKPIQRKIKVRKAIPQNSVVSGQADVTVQMNYRKLGSAYYACYEDAWLLNYVVKNRSAKTTEAEFRFPMPADQGVYDQFTVLVDDKNWSENLIYKDNAQVWTMPMNPGQETRVQVHYLSRGMDYIRYSPANMATRDTYKVAMHILPDKERRKPRFVWTEDMRPPMGSMTPGTIADSPADGEPMELAWDLKSAATTLDMGVVLPKIPQPGYYSARLLHEAPWGLVLLVASLVVSWRLLGREFDLFSLAILAVAYYLFYTLVAYLSDHVDSFPTCFILGTLATLLLSGLLLWIGWGRNFAAHQTMALVAVFTVYYPLAVALDEYAGLLVQILYWALAAYAAALAVARVWRARRQAA